MPEKIDTKTIQARFFATRHKCDLDEDEDILMPKPAPYAPSSKKFVSYLHKWTILSRHNPRTKTYFRSQSSIWQEKRRHVRNRSYRFVIHPFSRFCMARELMVTLMWMISFVIDPFISSFLGGYLKERSMSMLRPVLYVQLILNFLYLIDIFFTFFIGYTVERTKEIILDPGKIVKRYLSTYFVFDFVGATWDVILFFCGSSTCKSMGIAQLYAFRFVRMKTMLSFLAHNLHLFNVRESFVRCLTISVFTLYVLHWLTCFFYVVPAIMFHLDLDLSNSWVLEATFVSKDRTIFNLYIECLMCIVCHFFGAGKGSVDTRNETEQLILSITVMCGVACHIYAIAVILQLFGTINVSESKYEELIYQLNEYMVTKKLPQPLRKRLFMYYEYRFQKQFFLEDVILSSLSEHLRFEVLLYSCRNLIEKVRIFHGASKAVIGTILSMMKSEIFLPNDVIIKPESVNENVYFISFGTVTVMLPNGKEIVHMEDGHHFGEVNLILRNVGEKSFTSVVAIEITEVFYLSRSDFLYCVTTYPEIVDRLEKVAVARLSLYYEKMEGSSENIDTMDIITELRKGRILDRGRKRL